MALELDGYIRVSRVGGREGDSFMSPDDQREKIETWARLQGVTIGAWHIDLDRTGGDFQRPGFEAMMERVQAGETGGVAVAFLDRLSRADVSDALLTVQAIHEVGGRLAALDLGIDPTTPFGEFGLTLMLALARMQRRRIADTWATARRRAVERGVHIASRVPTGYLRDDETGRLKPDPQVAPVVREVFELRAGGASWKQLCTLMNTRAVAGPYDTKNWTTRSVEHLIRNRAYLGEARSGEYVHPGAHPALADDELWHAAQRVLSGPAARSETPALLAGLLRCAGCRHVMKPDKMRLRSGELVRMYRCRGQHSTGVCESRAAVLGSVIEPWVETQVLRVLAEMEARQVPATARLDELRAAWNAAERELAAFRDDERIEAALGAGSDRYLEGLRSRVERADTARAAFDDERFAQRPTGRETAELRAMWPDLEVRQKQKALRAVIDAVLLRSVGQSNVPIESRAIIFAAGTAPADLPRRGLRVPFAPFRWPDDLPAGSGVELPEDAEEDLLQG